MHYFVLVEVEIAISNAAVHLVFVCVSVPVIATKINCVDSAVGTVSVSVLCLCVACANVTQAAHRSLVIVSRM